METRIAEFDKAHANAAFANHVWLCKNGEVIPAGTHRVIPNDAVLCRETVEGDYSYDVTAEAEKAFAENRNFYAEPDVNPVRVLYPHTTREEYLLSWIK